MCKLAVARPQCKIIHLQHGSKVQPGRLCSPYNEPTKRFLHLKKSFRWAAKDCSFSDYVEPFQSRHICPIFDSLSICNKTRYQKIKRFQAFRGLKLLFGIKAGVRNKITE